MNFGSRSRSGDVEGQKVKVVLASCGFLDSIAYEILNRRTKICFSLKSIFTLLEVIKVKMTSLSISVNGINGPIETLFFAFESLSKINMRLNDDFFHKVIVSQLFKVKCQLYVQFSKWSD